MNADAQRALDYRDRARELIRMGHWSLNSLEGIAFIEEAVRLADEHHDGGLGYAARIALTETAILASTDKSLVAFSWCLAYADENPDRCDQGRLLSLYMTILGNIWDFPSIPQNRIDATFEDFLKRSLAAGGSPRAHHKMHCWMKMDEGDLDGAKRDFELWRRAPADWLSDCCESHESAFQARYHRLQGNDELALRIARKVVKSTQGCEDPRISIRSDFLEFLVQRGHHQEAARWHAQAYAASRDRGGMVYRMAKHLIYLTLTDQRAKAARLFQRHFPEAYESAVPFPKYYFLLASLFAWERLIECGCAALKLNLPERSALHRDDNVYSAVDLAVWLRQETESLADQFDRRSQSAAASPSSSNYRRIEMERVLGLKRDIAPMPSRLS